MNAKELLNKLLEIEKSGKNLSDYDIVTEGCDCDGIGDDVKVFENYSMTNCDKVIYIKRPAGDGWNQKEEE